MENDKIQTVKKYYETAESLHARSLGSSIPTGRPNLNEILNRNEEERKQDRKSVYAIVGAMTLLTGVIITLVYFFS